MAKGTDPKSRRDRNLLFGVIAVQLHFIKPADLGRASVRWAADQDQSLGDVLAEMGLLDQEKKAVIEQLLDLQVKEHGDASASLQAFGGNRAVHESFAAAIAVKDEGVECTLRYDDDRPDTVARVPSPAQPLESFGGQPEKTIADSSGPKVGERLDDSEHITLEHPGRYTVKREHGRGGIGRVLVVFDEHVGRDVALKELIPDTASAYADPAKSPLRVTAAATARFLREARITGQLEHPSIVPVYEIAKRSDGATYYTMKLVRGKTLAEKLKEIVGETSGLDESRAGARSHNLSDHLSLLPHFLDLCQAMAYAHSKGVIHRDLKPANIMIGEFGETVVLDWGLAKVKGLADERAEDIEEGLKLIKECAPGETMKGQPIGTPAYMSPEQADGRIDEVDERSDVWSLGAILYENLTGAPPFTGESAFEVMGKVISQEVPPVSRIESQAPPELAAIAMKCLSKDPARRYASAQELSADVAAFSSGARVSAYDYSLPERALRWVKGHPVATTAIFALVLIFALGAWSWARIREQRNIAKQNENHALENLDQAKDNLSRGYLNMARWSEERKELQRAELYSAKSMEENDNPASRYNLNHLRTAPKIRADFLRTLEGHQERVNSVSFSPDGKTLASGSYDNMIKLWDTKTGTLLLSLERDQGGVWSVAFSPDGMTLVSGSANRTIKLWNLETGELLRSLEGHKDSVGSVAFSPDGKNLASGSGDNTVKLWNAETGKLLRSLEGHKSWVSCVTFSPDGKTLASASYDATIKLWSRENGELLRSLEGHQGWIESIAFSPDKKTLASGSRQSMIKLWNLETGEIIRSLEGHKGWINSIAFSPDGTILASGSGNKSIKLWDAQTGEILHTLEGHQDSVNSIAFCQEGTILASGSHDNTIKLWSIERNKFIRPLKGHQASIWSVAFSPGGKTLASGSWDNTIKLWNIETGELLHSLDVHQPNYANSVVFSLSPDGKTLASGYYPNTIKVRNLETGELLRSLEGHTGLVESVAFSPDGEILASGSEDKTVKLWNMETGELIRSLEGDQGLVESVAFSPDGKILASGGGDKTIKLWNIATGVLLRSLKGHQLWVKSVSFSPDGKILASGSGDSTTKLWNIETGELIRSLQGHQDFVNSIKFSPDGKTLASGSHDYTVMLWNTETGEFIRSLEGHRGQVLSVAFSPDGKTLASGSGDKTIMFWPFLPEIMDGDPEEILADTERRTGLKVIGMDVYPWDPATGEVSEEPLARPF